MPGGAASATAFETRSLKRESEDAKVEEKLAETACGEN
jgi:hypothetical protein